MSNISFPPPKALLFDLMGTCCDWYSSILNIINASPSIIGLPPQKREQLAKDWRAGFFSEIHARFRAGQPSEDIDITHRRVLDDLLALGGIGNDAWDNDVRKKLVVGWHDQTAWPDAINALERLKKDYFIVVLANGTTRLQLDIVKSSGLPFHMLFSSELLGLTKPDPEIYRKAVALIGLQPENCCMVAAHAYDLRAAKEVGLKTIYIRRRTEDLDEDMERVKCDVDIFLDGSDGTQHCGLGELADILRA